MMMLKATRNNWTTSRSQSQAAGVPWTRRPSRVVTMAPPPSLFGNYNNDSNNNDNNDYNTTYNNKKRMIRVMVLAMAGVAMVAMIVNIHFARNPASQASSPSSPSSSTSSTDVGQVVDDDAFDFMHWGGGGGGGDSGNPPPAAAANDEKPPKDELRAENEKTLAQELEFARQTNSVERAEYILAKQRYLSANPPGHRQHPSYYSHAYMRQAKSVNHDTEQEQQELTANWGAWTLVDAKFAHRPMDKFIRNQKQNHDWPLSKFPEGAWQSDSEYLKQFLTQAITLTVRAKEAILTEYGLDPDTFAAAKSFQQGVDIDNVEVTLEERSRPFLMQLFNAETESFPHNLQGNVGPLNQGGWMSLQTMASLKRRLLHAIMTQGTFTLATVGHNAAAGHGNHFQQSFPLQAGRILEPILARLGVHGKAHNLAMGTETSGGSGSLPFALGANDIIGHNVDVLVWDAKDADDQENDIGLFATQTLLSGRAPILMFAENVHPVMQTLIDDNQATFQGAMPLVRLGSGMSVLDHLDVVNTEPDADEQQPWATRYLKCGTNISHYCQVHTYNATCWLNERSTHSNFNYLWEGDLEVPSFTPPTPQQANPPGRVGWNPGWRRHLLQSRVLAFTILQALHEALAEWQAQPNHLLPDSAWHVTSHYSQISTAISQSNATDQWCINKQLPLAFCRVPMHARTEYTPRTSPWSTSLRSIIKAAGVVPRSAPNAYDPPDVDNPYLQQYDMDESAIDVVAIIENGVDFQPNLARMIESNWNEQAYLLAQEAMKAAQTTGRSVNPAIQGGFGWELQSVGSDNCDGTYDSFCNRGPANDCMLAGYNDGKYGLLFDGYSGWMVFSLNIVRNKQGVIVVSMSDAHTSRLAATEGWCSENNAQKDCPGGARHGRRLNHQRQRRQQEQPLAYCADFKFEFAINGQITTWDLTQFQQQQRQVQQGFNMWTLASGVQGDAHTDSILSQVGQTVELAIRTTGCGRDKVLELTHIYWA